MDFKSGQQLIGLCETNECPISEIMLIREETFTERTRKDIINQMGKTWQIMKESAHSSVENPKHSIGGLIGGEAKLLSEHLSSGKSICKDPLSRAITYSMSILETSASMGLIVAAPTAGSAGIVPGLLLALQETYDFSDNDIIRVLFNAGAVGCLAMRNATVAGAVGGCQAEVGVASAMAASAAVELMQGTARQCLDARVHRTDEYARTCMRPCRRSCGMPLSDAQRIGCRQRINRSRDCFKRSPATHPL